MAFEGVDGAGKSTSALELAKTLQTMGVDAVFIDKKNARSRGGYASDHLDTIASVLWRYSPDDPIHQLGDRHWMHLLCAWFAGLHYAVIEPHLSRGTTVVTDSWYYKFMARFLLKTTLESSEVTACFLAIPKPEIVAFIDVTVEDAAHRKSEYSATESGNLDGLEGRTRENFMVYQRAIRAELKRLSVEQSWELMSGGNTLAGTPSHADVVRLAGTVAQHLSQSVGSADYDAGGAVGAGV